MKTFKQLTESLNKKWVSIHGDNEVVGETDTHYKVKSSNEKYERLIRKSSFNSEVNFEVKQYNSKMKRKSSNSDVSNGEGELPREIVNFTKTMSAIQKGKATKTLLDKGIRHNGKFYKNKLELAKALKTQGYKLDGDNLVSGKDRDVYLDGKMLGKVFLDFYKTI